MLKIKEADFIKIPRDFKDLHDLKELVGDYDLIARLSNVISGYQRAYVDSYLMTADQVLAYIPADKHNEYKVRTRSDFGPRLTTVCDNSVKWHIANKKYNGATYYDNGKIKNVKDNQCTLKWLLDYKMKDCKKTDKILIVDTKNKIIDICFWNMNSKKYNGDAGVTYTGIVNFVVVNKKLTAHVHYELSAVQSVGGAWINGRARGYLSGETRHPYTIHGYDIYEFCTRRNIYLGYFGFKQDPHKEWMEIRSKY